MHGNIESDLVSHAPVINDPMVDWYALLIDPGIERKATIWFKRRQFQPYWPRYKGQVKLNRHRRGMRWRSVLPGYLFVPLDRFSDINWPLIERAPGFRRIMSYGTGNYVHLTGTEMEAICNIETALNSSELCAAEGIPFKIGQRVRWMDEAWQWEGPIVKIEKGRKITVEVTFLGAQRQITLPADGLEPA